MLLWVSLSCVGSVISLKSLAIKIVVFTGLVSKGVFTNPVSESWSPAALFLKWKRWLGPWPVDPTYGVGETGPEIKSFTLPQFKPLSIELSLGSKVYAQLKLWIARPQLETQKRKEEWQFQLWRELQLKRLETKTAIKTRQLELQKATVCSPVSDQSSDSSTFDVSINIYWVPAFHKCEFESYFTCVRELMLPEEPYCLFECNVVYLNEQKVDTLQQATYLADQVGFFSPLVAGVSLSQF